MGKEQFKPNRLLQTQNEALLDKCFWRGKWWENGVPNPGGTVIERTKTEVIRMIQGKEYRIPRKKK